MLEQFLDLNKIGERINQASETVNDKIEVAQQQYERFNRLEDDVNILAQKAKEIDDLKQFAQNEINRIKKYAILGFGIIAGLELIAIILTIIFLHKTVLQ